MLAPLLCIRVEKRLVRSEFYLFLSIDSLLVKTHYKAIEACSILIEFPQWYPGWLSKTSPGFQG